MFNDVGIIVIAKDDTNWGKKRLSKITKKVGKNKIFVFTRNF